MASNYDNSSLPDGMLGTPHSHSDGETQVDVNKFHGSGMTSGAGSSQTEYPDTEKSDEGEKEVTSSSVQDSEPATGTPRVSPGARG